MFSLKNICKTLYRYKPLLISRFYSGNLNPFEKTWNVISKDFTKNSEVYPEHADIVIIGGGFLGSSVAYWLKMRAGEGLSVVVIEKDTTYQKAQKNLALGTAIQHYSLPENIYLSQFGAEFLRSAKQDLNVDVQYCPNGHLVIASEKYAEKMEENVMVQKENGIRNELLTENDLKELYPWMNTEDICLGSIGTEGEGTFNSLALLQGLIQKSQKLGAIYVNAEVIGFEMQKQSDVLMEGVKPGTFKRIHKIIYRSPNNEEHAIKFSASILSAGEDSGDVAKLAYIGTSNGLLTIPLQVSARKHKLYSIEESAHITGLHTPIITDTSGLWLFRNGLQNNLICGHVPMQQFDAENSTDDEYLNALIKPALGNRIPELRDSKVNKFATEVYDYCKFDDVGVLGPHPYHNNLYIAAGFGKQGCYHAPGLGRAIAELIIDTNFISIDLTRFGFDRFLTEQPLYDFNIY